MKTSRPQRSKRRLGFRLPSWLISVFLHAAVLVVVGLTIRMAPRPGAGAERTAEVGIALKHQDGQEEYYESESSAGQAPSAATSTDSGSLEDLLDESPVTDPTGALPSAMNIIGPSAIEPAGPFDPGSALGQPYGGGDLAGGKTRVNVFGTTGEGANFIYVFDCSASMSGGANSPMRAAKTELLNSLQSLDSVHRFQIIFYNEKPRVFNPSGETYRLAFATDQAKEAARRFVGSIMAVGGTKHEPALMQAVKFRPDVIFFLTDADEPQLSAGQLYEIQRQAAGITINAIEFGIGPKSGDPNFLEKLARQNGGQYSYVDITTLRSK